MGEYSASRSSHLTRGEQAPNTHWMGKPGGTHSRCERCGEGNVSVPVRIPNSTLRSTIPLASRFTQCAIVVH